MAQLKNPKIEVRVFGEEPFVIPNELWMDVQIEKDLDSEPNTATITAYNLAKDGLRGKLENARDQSAPIEIHMTPSDSEEFVLAFQGEIDDVVSEPMKPGYETVITAFSGKEQTRNAYIDQKTYAAGTPKKDIISDLVDALNMPIGFIDEAVSAESKGIVISESFSGPAFQLLQQYVFDLGMFAYIMDGKIYITSVAQPQTPNTKTIKRNFLLSTPRKTKRVDDLDIEMKTIAENFSGNLFAGKRSRKKKKNKPTEVVGANDYVEYEAVDKTVTGINFFLRLLPDLQPGDVITIEDYPDLQNRRYHITATIVDADNHGGAWNITAETDEYDDSGGDLDLDIETDFF